MALSLTDVMSVACLQNFCSLHLPETILLKSSAALKFCDSKIFNSRGKAWFQIVKELFLRVNTPFSFSFSGDVAQRIAPVYAPYFLFLSMKCAHFHTCWLKRIELQGSGIALLPAPC